MNVGVAITTCDREQFGKRNTWPRMWESMERSGFREQMGPHDRFGIFDAGPAGRDWIRTFPRAKTFIAAGPPGYALDLIRNAHRALAWLCGTGCEFGLLLVDDCLCCKNWFAELKRWLHRDAPRDAVAYAVASRYPWSRDAGNMKRRWAPYPREQIYFSLCVFPRHVLVDYLFSDLRQRYEAAVRGTDHVVRDMSERLGKPIYAHCPDLFAHIGESESTLGHIHKPGPHDAMFPGEDFDALGTADDLPPWQAQWEELKRSQK